MTSESSQELPIKLSHPKLNLEQTHEQILTHQNSISFGRRIIIFCISTMLISAIVSLTMVVNMRLSEKKVMFHADTAYLTYTKSLAITGNENALIWIAVSGYSTANDFKKLSALAQTTTNPHIIEALLKSDDSLKKSDAKFKGLSEADIKSLEQKGISLGSVQLIEERHMGSAK